MISSGSSNNKKKKQIFFIIQLGPSKQTFYARGC
jgi:hypothetical protein